MEIPINHSLEIEQMASFFDKRADGYEDHMMQFVSGADEYYIETAKYIPKDNGLKLLDLGCGTGLELEEIFKVNPTIKFTGIDLSTKMLEKLTEKYKLKKEQITLVNKSYFDVDYGKNAYDSVLSVMTLHHFTHDEKLKLYKKVYDGLVHGGTYVETDYVAEDQEYEDYFYSELRRIKTELNITEGFYHYDTPCTSENIIMLMKTAGFSDVELKWQSGSTAIIVAKK